MPIDSKVPDIDWQLENSLFEKCINLVESTRVDVNKFFIVGFFEMCFKILLKLQADIRSIHTKTQKIR